MSYEPRRRRQRARTGITTVAALAVAAAAAFAVAPAQAQAQQGERMVRGVFGAGLTAGGDKLATVQWSNGDSTNIKAGGLVDLRAGVDVKLGDTPFAVQASIGWFVHRAGGSNGSVTFERFPIELLGTWRAAEQWRFGAGLRRAGNAKLKGRGVASNIGTTSYDANTGVVVEGEWLFATRYGVALRYVSEEYTAPNGTKADGSHVGVRFNVYF